MKAVKETTQWDTGTSNHTYLLDGTALVAYIPAGTHAPYWFKRPIKGFDTRGRKFEAVSLDLFPREDIFHVARTQTVMGSKGAQYTVNLDDNTCSCPGYTYRGACKHVKELA
jgi:hypothetical protein